MALKINFKDFKAQFPFRFKAKTTREEANKLLSGIEANMDILPNFEVEEGTEVNSAFFRQLEKDINADQVRQDEAFQIAIDNIKVPVQSVNEKTGHVTLTASDVGAVPTERKVNNKTLSTDITLTKADVGLGNVENYGVATAAEAQAGVVNNKYMTPERTRETVGVHGGMKRRVFTDNGTFVVPPNVTEIYVTACGGGGGSVGSDAKGGGGSACIIGKPYTVVPGQIINITIGAGGVNGAGGTTVISGVVSLLGGTVGNDSGAGKAGGIGGGDGGGAGGGGSYGDGGSYGHRVGESVGNPIATSNGGGGGARGVGGSESFSSQNRGEGAGYGGGGARGKSGGKGIAIIEW